MLFNKVILLIVDVVKSRLGALSVSVAFPVFSLGKMTPGNVFVNSDVLRFVLRKRHYVSKKTTKILVNVVAVC